VGGENVRRRTVAAAATIAIALIVAGAGASAASFGRAPTAVKPVVFTDPAGDAQGAAPDITRVQVSNDNAGVVTFEVDLQAANTIDVDGNALEIFIDADKNRYTGNRAGEEYAVAAFGGNPASFDSFKWDGSQWVVTPSSLEVAKNGAGSLFFKIDSRDLQSKEFAFEVYGIYTDSAQNAFFDFAPDSDLWSYAVHGPDTDGDGLPDERDACPSVKPSYDPNNNGCPGPYRVMSAKVTLAWDPNGTFLRPLGVSRLPAGARVTVTCRRGCRLSGQRTVGSDGGTIGFRQFKGLRLGRGGLIEVRATKKGWIGYVGLIRGVGPPKGLSIIDKCQPPTGGSPAPCSTVGQGS
jgi:hypothetical protein